LDGKKVRSCVLSNSKSKGVVERDFPIVDFPLLLFELKFEKRFC
jgi:hypothetical protein